MSLPRRHQHVIYLVTHSISQPTATSLCSSTSSSLTSMATALPFLRLKGLPREAGRDVTPTVSHIVQD